MKRRPISTILSDYIQSEHRLKEIDKQLESFNLESFMPTGQIILAQDLDLYLSQKDMFEELNSQRVNEYALNAKLSTEVENLFSDIGNRTIEATVKGAYTSYIVRVTFEDEELKIQKM